MGCGSPPNSSIPRGADWRGLGVWLQSCARLSHGLCFLPHCGFKGTLFLSCASWRVSKHEYFTGEECIKYKVRIAPLPNYDLGENVMQNYRQNDHEIKHELWPHTLI